MIQPIHHTFGPHVTWSYWAQSVSLLFQPWKWKHGNVREILRGALASHFDAPVFLFGSGREALLALFRSLKLESGAEIVIQGYTCVALPNAIHAAGCTPVYADIDPETLNFSVTSLERVITTRTRAILCQHTFGMPADIAAIKNPCSQKNLILIEDLAHSIPENTSTIGNMGDYVMLSFGRDKAVSGVAGGALISRVSEKNSLLEMEEEQAIDLSMSVIWRLLLYPATYLKSRLMYGFLSIGKVILVLAKILNLLIPILTKEEKRGYMSAQIHRMPNACAALALWEWKKLAKINQRRRKLAVFYQEEAIKKSWKFPKTLSADLPLQKFPLLFPKADDIRAALKDHLVFLEDGWTGAAVCPRNIDHTATDYAQGSCPNAEQTAREILSLPTHPTMTLKQADKLISLLQKYVVSGM